MEISLSQFEFVSQIPTASLIPTRSCAKPHRRRAPASQGLIGNGARFAIAVLAAAALAACSGPRGSDYEERPVETLYEEAIRNLELKRFNEAVAFFDEVERQHPYSPWARRAMLMSAYASYEANEYEDAIASIDRFLALHPGNKDAPYAYYLRAICYYERIQDVNRDQALTADALNALNEVVRRYPGTDYARDARLKVDMTRDHLAGKEMLVGRFYLKQEKHIGAINRFRRVVEEYQTTTHTPEALHRLTEAYLELGMFEEAQATAAVLGYNFPGSRWYADSYRMLRRRNLEPQPSEDDKSWLTRAFSAVF
ncbi:MAG: outer membrane protein assembly factor BamD [Parvularculaceae bacterium]